MAILVPEKAIKDYRELKVGDVIWGASMQFRPGYVADYATTITDLGVAYKDSRFYERPTIIGSSLDNAIIIGMKTIDPFGEVFESHFFASDNNMMGGEASYNDHFYFRSREDAEEYIAWANGQIAVDESVRIQYEWREGEDSFLDDDWPDDDFYEPREYDNEDMS